MSNDTYTIVRITIMSSTQSTHHISTSIRNNGIVEIHKTLLIYNSNSYMLACYNNELYYYISTAPPRTCLPCAL
jgi:hypothetical protein